MKNSEFRKLDNSNRRETILDFACELFAQKGYDAVTTMELSLTIGCSETMLLSIFPTKSEIYNTLFEEWRLIISEPPSLEIINGSSLDTLEKYFNDFTSRRFKRNYEMRPNLERALISRTTGGAKKRMYDAATAAPDFITNAVLPLIKAGQEKGEIKNGDPTELSNFFWAMTQGAYYSKQDFPTRFKSIPSSIVRNILGVH